MCKFKGAVSIYPTVGVTRLIFNASVMQVNQKLRDDQNFIIQNKDTIRLPTSDENIGKEEVLEAVQIKV